MKSTNELLAKLSSPAELRLHLGEMTAQEMRTAQAAVRYTIAATAPLQPRTPEPQWSGWACQYPGKLPRLYGAREIAELNLDEENGDQLLFLQAQPRTLDAPISLPELPPLDMKAVIPYESIRYVAGYPEDYVKRYATAYALAAGRAATPAPTHDLYPPAATEATDILMALGYSYRQTETGLRWVAATPQQAIPEGDAK